MARRIKDSRLDASHVAAGDRRPNRFGQRRTMLQIGVVLNERVRQGCVGAATAKLVLVPDRVPQDRSHQFDNGERFAANDVIEEGIRDRRAVPFPGEDTGKAARVFHVLRWHVPAKPVLSSLSGTARGTS